MVRDGRTDAGADQRLTCVGGQGQAADAYGRISFTSKVRGTINIGSHISGLPLKLLRKRANQREVCPVSAGLRTRSLDFKREVLCSWLLVFGPSPSPCLPRQDPQTLPQRRKSTRTLPPCRQDTRYGASSVASGTAEGISGRRASHQDHESKQEHRFFFYTNWRFVSFMDAGHLHPAALAQPFAGEVESVFGPGPAADDPGVWMASNDGDESMLSSFESGGALMNSGGWSISTAPGEECLRWNAVKTEVFDDWAGLASGGPNKSSPLQPPVLPGTTKTKAGSAGFPGVVKADPEEGWEELMAPPPAYSWPPSAAAGSAAVSAATTPNSPPSSSEPLQPLITPALGGKSVLFISGLPRDAFSCKGRAMALLPCRGRWRRAGAADCDTSRVTLIGLRCLVFALNN